MEPHLSPLPPLEPPKPPKKASLKAAAAVFVAAFVLLLVILNLPTLIKGLAYPFTHSDKANNEQLTQQYRDIYGYEKHPELITAVEAAPLATPSIYPIAQPGFQAELSIPKINVSAPILQPSDSSDNTILTTLKNGVVLYPGSTNPGQPGTTVIIGHSSSNLPWTKYSSIFSLLDRLQPNDLMYVSMNGTQYVYRVRTVQKGSAQQLIDSGLAGDLIVSTCWPIGTDAKRIAVSASLVQ